MKYLISRFSFLFFVLLVVQFSTAQRNVIDQVIWVVGDEPILLSDVENQKLQMQYQGEKIDGDPNCVIPEQIAIQKLFLHQAKLDSVVVGESAVNGEVDRRINYFIGQIGSKEKLEEYFNKPLAQIREELQGTVRDQMIVQQMQQKLIGDVKVTPEDVRKFFQELNPDSIPTVPATVEIQTITEYPSIPQVEIDRVKARLRDFANRVDSGTTDFSTLAMLYSEDPESAKHGGELGFMGRGQLVPEFANVAFSLTDPKKVSRVVQTEFGFHILQLIVKQGDRVNVRHILIKPIVSLQAENAALHHLDSIANLIRTSKVNFDEAVMHYSMDKNTVMNKGLMMNAATGTSKFELQQLTPEIAKQANNLNVGELSKAFVMMNPENNREECAVVKVKNKIPSHKANLSDDYQLLKSMLESQEKADIITGWITKRQKDTYIYIDPQWRNCTFKYSGWIKK
jgi:peptidyl-prolyl cis-trans isomerase SurA